MPLRVIPVLDVKAGLAVHAIGGQRDHYRPVRSLLHPSSEPTALARAYRDRLGLNTLYLADLDAIAGAPANLALYRTLLGLGLDLWLDAGVRDAGSLSPLLSANVSTVVVGLETVRGPAALAEMLDRAGRARLAFSLDLRDGHPLCAPGADWGTTRPETLAGRVLSLGIRRLILLDLSRVGRGRGIGTLPLLENLANEHPDAELVAGGGVSGPSDLIALAGTRAAAVLVGSALHDGRVGASDLPGSRPKG